MPGLSPNADAPRVPSCEECGSELAPDQAYCITCGHRIGSSPFVTPAAAAAALFAAPAAPRSAITKAAPVPPPRTALVFAAMTIGFGAFLGLTLGPSIAQTHYVIGPDTLASIGAAPSGKTAGGGGSGSGSGSSSSHGSSGLGGAGGGGLGSLGSGSSSGGLGGSSGLGTSSFPSGSSGFTSPPTTVTGGGSSGGSGGSTGGGGSGNTATKGTVVHTSAVSSSYTLATTDEKLVAVHAKKLPDPGMKLTVNLIKLANGTYSEQGDRTHRGKTSHADFTGTATWRDQATGAYTVSARGTSMLVTASGSNAPKPPTVGRSVTVDAGIHPLSAAAAKRWKHDAARATAKNADASAKDNPCADETPPATPAPTASLSQRSRKIGDKVGSTDLAGIIEGGACADSHELTITADDVGQSGALITIKAARNLELGKFKVGDALVSLASIDKQDNALKELTGLSLNNNEKDADNKKLLQGSLAPSPTSAKRGG